LLACVAVNLYSGILAVEDINPVDKGVYQSRAEKMIVCITIFELFKEEPNLVVCEDWADHLFPRKLRFKVCTFSLALLYLRRKNINSFARFNSLVHNAHERKITMIAHIMKSNLPGANAEQFYEFMINPPPEVYAHWLPNEHHVFHVVKYSKTTPVGDLIFFDQHISPKHRLKFFTVTKTANKPSRVVYQMRKFGVNIPGYLELEFCDASDGLLLIETIRIGYNSIGKALDPFIRMVFNKSFFEALDGHHKREWADLAKVLSKQKSVV